MRKILISILLTLLLVILSSAQTAERKPVLLDEFGRMPLEAIMASLDSFIIELSTTPGTKGLIRIYGGDENCFACHYHRGSLLSAYLNNTRKFSPERYSIEYCIDNKEDMRTQLYLLPTLTTLPKCEENSEIPKKSALFNEIFFESDSNKLSPLEDSVIEIGPSDKGEYSLDGLKMVKSLLDKSPESRIYVISYLGMNIRTSYEDKNGETIERTKRKLDKKSFAKKMLQNAKNELIKNGVNSSQIETIEGGYVIGERKLEFWFVPKDGEIPIPKPNYFPNKRRSKK